MYEMTYVDLLPALGGTKQTEKFFLRLSHMLVDYMKKQLDRKTKVFLPFILSFKLGLIWFTLKSINTYQSIYRVWQSCRVRYLFFTSYGSARSTTCESVLSFQVGVSQPKLVYTSPTETRLLEKREVDL